MDEERIIELYEKGFSIKYIIDEEYLRKKVKNYSFYNFGNRKVLICTNNITKAQVIGEVYKILYEYKQKIKDRPI